MINPALFVQLSNLWIYIIKICLWFCQYVLVVTAAPLTSFSLSLSYDFWLVFSQVIYYFLLFLCQCRYSDWNQRFEDLAYMKMKSQKLKYKSLQLKKRPKRQESWISSIQLRNQYNRYAPSFLQCALPVLMGNI